MIDAHVPQPRPEDLKPTRLHWVWLGTAVLVQAVIYLAVTSHWDVSLFQKISSAMAWSFPFVTVFGWLLGGPVKLWDAWRDRNFYGNYFVVWLKGPNDLDCRFVDRKNLRNFVMPGWSLHIPLGGWFTRPFLAHSNNRPRHSQNFRVGAVRWDWSFNSVLVRDRSRGVWSTRPERLLRDLQEAYPDGDWHHQSHKGLEHVALAVDLRESRLASDLADTKEKLGRQHALAAAGIGVVWETIWDIFKTSRLDGVKSKEGRTVREKLTAYYRNLESMPGAAVHDFRLLLPVDKNSARPERISSNGPVQKMF